MSPTDSLTPERWRQVDQVFAAVLEQPPDTRETWLRETCGDDLDLYREVSRLLEVEQKAARAIGDDAGALLRVWDGAGGDGEEGADGALPYDGRVGDYHLVREIGRGGMARVYLAERRGEGFQQSAALKLVRRGVDTDDVLRRFRHERRLLASLEHPNIARFLDGGAAPDGRPFVAIEYVEGRPITHHCDQERLSVEERLELFLTVCEAVAYAHRRLIVHRDIKPSNVLVTRSGHVKLLDFGIAKLLASEDDPLAPRTRTELRILTPEYAAPEQIRGGAMSTATDVYGLGVLLYELLAGRRPHASEGRGRWFLSPGSEPEAPPPPSTAVAGGPEPQQQAAVAAARDTRPSRLRRTLAGDLDGIVLRALSVEPEARYGSAAELAEDIRRYRSGLPVRARSAGALYRARKVVRRHWRSLGTAGVAALALVGSVVTSTLERARTERARQEAVRERETAEQVAGFMESLFTAANPYAANAERLDTFSLAGLLDRGARRVGEDLGDRPLVQARMLRILGRSHRGLGDLEAAAPLLERSVATLRSLGEAHTLELAASLNELGNVALDRRQDAEAEALHREALALRRAHLPETDRRVRASLANLASAIQNQGRLPEADSLYARVLGEERRDPAPDSSLLMDVLNARAALAHRQQAFDRAIRLSREALEISRARLGAEHPRVTQEMGNLAVLLDQSGRMEEAEPLMRDVIARARRELGPEHPQVGFLQGNLAVLLARLDRPNQARPVFEEALAHLRDALTGPHPAFAGLLDAYGRFLLDSGEVAAAIATQREAVGVASALAPGGQQLARLQAGLAASLCAGGRGPEGQAILRRLVSETDLPSGDPALDDVQNLLDTCGA